MGKYNLHPDFKYSKYIYAPITNMGVKVLNYFNVKGIKSIHYSDKLKISELTIPASDGYEIPVTRFEPKNNKAIRPCIVYFHGGGFRIKGSGLVARNLEEYALKLDAVAFMIDYRLMPEHKFPRPFLDAYESTLWIEDNCKSLGIDPRRIAVAGASAGGNLTAAVALKARDVGRPKLCHQMLIYPALDYKQQYDSIEKYNDAPIWNKSKNKAMWEEYIDEEKMETIGYASPIHHENFCDLPPTYIEVAEYDCLVDEGIAYGDMLQEAGIPVELHVVNGGVHGYDNYVRSKYIDYYVDRRIEVLQEIFYGGKIHGS